MQPQDTQTKNNLPCWSWGGLPPMKASITSPWKTSSRIEGHTVILISDIRKAPGGDNWRYIEDRKVGSELLIRVVDTVATDRFTLYLEASSLEGESRSLIGGIHLDASNRKANAVLTEHIVRFQHPLQKEWPYIDLKKPLLPANDCTLSEKPKSLPVELSQVEVRQKMDIGHHYLMRSGIFSNGKMLIRVDHDFPVTGFKLEYEPMIKYSKVLNAELFAIQDHSISNCTCKRKERISSLLEVELSKFGPEKPDTVMIWGPNVTWANELMINNSTTFTEYQ